MGFYDDNQQLNWRIGRAANRPSAPPGRDAGWWSWDTDELWVTTEGMTWVQVNQSAEEMTGATSGADGTGGTVPQPLAGEERTVLRGDATWQPFVDHPTAIASLTVPTGRGLVLSGEIEVSGAITVNGALAIV